MESNRTVIFLQDKIMGPEFSLNVTKRSKSDLFHAKEDTSPLNMEISSTAHIPCQRGVRRSTGPKIVSQSGAFRVREITLESHPAAFQWLIF
jgi:hypothetical protein